MTLVNKSQIYAQAQALNQEFSQPEYIATNKT